MGDDELLAWIKQRPVTCATYPLGSAYAMWFWGGETRPGWAFPVLLGAALICFLAPAVDKHRRLRRARGAS